MTRKLPPSASVVSAQEGAKLHAPAAARNADILCDLISRHGPKTGRALEIASGTGQHVTRFAHATPDLDWQPTEVEAERLASIQAYSAETGLRNIRPSLPLNAARPDWSQSHNGFDLIVLLNLLHLISEPDAETVITEAMSALRPEGVFILYGPFMRDGVLTSEGDKRFDADLRGADPDIGYKDDAKIVAWLENAGAASVTIEEMPANNLAFISRC